ncbi:MAG: tyrosine--tRNA ligase [Rickettsiales bacterium]|jgi:tyrosyl-tRNA synthetase|nr:tyrosine--tRNA ligase [Rickettsiales bacterium]
MKFKSDFLREMDARGFINQCSDFDGLDKHFSSQNATIYLGSDPTADSLHVGHLVPIMMMRWAQKFGHTPILLVGGATGHIGDPDKNVERPILTSEVIAKNSLGLKKSYSKFLQFNDTKSQVKNPAIMVDNYDWFKNINYLEFLRDVGMVVSVNKLITLDRIKKRLDNDLHLSFLELNYPLFQSYDFLVLHEKYKCSVQLCGSDQWGNAIGGIDLIKRKTGDDVFVLTAPLLTTSDGKKMGKSEGNAAWINEERASAYDYYQFFRNVPDDMVGKMLLMYTELPIDEIEKLSALKDAELNEAKKILAFEATKICRGIEEALSAEKTAIDTFEHGMVGDNLPTHTINGAKFVVDILIECGVVSSKSEARRLIEQDAVKIDDVKVTSATDVAIIGVVDDISLPANLVGKLFSFNTININANAILSVGKKTKIVLKKG